MSAFRGVDAACRLCGEWDEEFVVRKFFMVISDVVSVLYMFKINSRIYKD